MNELHEGKRGMLSGHYISHRYSFAVCCSVNDFSVHRLCGEAEFLYYEADIIKKSHTHFFYYL